MGIRVEQALAAPVAPGHAHRATLDAQRDESAERFPSVITPLAWELVEEGFHRSLNYSFALMGLPPFKGKWFVMFDNYIYGNQNAVEVYANGAASSISIGSVAELAAAIPTLRRQYEWVLELPLTWSRDLDHYLMSLGELMATPLEEKDAAELWAYVLQVKELAQVTSCPTSRSRSRSARSTASCSASCRRRSARSRPRQSSIASSRTARPRPASSTRSCIVSRGASRRFPRWRRACASERRASFSTRAASAQAHRDLDAAFAKFLRDHGHREVEFDPYHATWVEAPWLVVENLKVMLDSRLEDPADKESELRSAMRETESALHSRLPQELRFFVHEIVRLARAYTTLDNVEHYQTTRLTLPFRKGLKALGARLQAMGVVTEPTDVFFAHYESMNSAIAAGSPAHWATLGGRRRFGGRSRRTSSTGARRRRGRSAPATRRRRARRAGSAACPGAPARRAARLHKATEARISRRSRRARCSSRARPIRHGRRSSTEPWR